MKGKKNDIEHYYVETKNMSFSGKTGYRYLFFTRLIRRYLKLAPFKLICNFLQLKMIKAFESNNNNS